MGIILIIDDDSFLLQSVENALKERDWGVTTAFTQARAAELVEYADVVLCDWDLGFNEPMTGDKIVESLREINPDARYIIWSGLERKVPEGVSFQLKSDILELFALIGDP